MDARVAVLASGEGTNLQALLDDPTIGPTVRLVVCDVPGAGAIARASSAGVEVEVVDVPRDRVADDDILEHLEARDIEFVVLAGFMRIVGPNIVDAFRDRMLNVHPSLLPAFPGARAVADALEHGVKVTGVTVHIVDEHVDHGPIVVQEAVSVRDEDDWDSLEVRIHAAEHRCLPHAVRAMLQGRLRVADRRVTIEEEG